MQPLQHSPARQRLREATVATVSRSGSLVKQWQYSYHGRPGSSDENVSPVSWPHPCRASSHRKPGSSRCVWVCSWQTQLPSQMPHPSTTVEVPQDAGDPDTAGALSHPGQDSHDHNNISCIHPLPIPPRCIQRQGTDNPLAQIELR